MTNFREMTTAERTALNQLRTRVTAAIADSGKCPAQFAVGMFINLVAKMIVQGTTAENIESVVTEVTDVLRMRIAHQQYESETD